MQVQKELVVACDFETQNEFVGANLKPYVIAFACKKSFELQNNFKIELQDFKKIEEDTIYFDSGILNFAVLNHFFDYLFSIKNYQKINIFFHNFKNFDGFFLIPYLLKNFKQKPTNSKLNNKEFSLIYLNNFLLNIKLNYNNIIFNFLDSLAFFPGQSLNSLGEIINKQKLDFNYNFDIKIEKLVNSNTYLNFVEYTKKDTEILADFLFYFVTTTKINLVNNLSIAGLAFKYFKENWSREGHFIENKENWNLINKSYFGGFCYLNPKFKNKILTNLNYYDINSAYPYILKGSLPYGEMQIYKNQKYGSKLYQLLIFELEVNDYQISIIRSKKYNEHFIKNTNTEFEYLIWEFEFEYIKMFYKTFKYKIINIFWFKTQTTIDKYVKYWYNIKLKNNTKTSAKEKLFNYFAKIMLNSLYGKFGEKILKTQRLYLDNANLEKFSIIELENKLYSVLTKHQNKTYNNLVEYSLQEQEVSTHKFKNIAVSSFVTAKVRTILYDHILNNIENFVYCDTDSLVLFNKKIDKYFVNENLGKWKIEYENVEGYFIQAKQYFLKHKEKLIYKTAGFQKLITQIDFNKIENESLIFEKLSSKKSAFGVVLTPQKSELKGGTWKKIE